MHCKQFCHAKILLGSGIAFFNKAEKWFVIFISSCRTLPASP